MWSFVRKLLRIPAVSESPIEDKDPPTVGILNKYIVRNGKVVLRDAVSNKSDDSTSGCSDQGC